MSIEYVSNDPLFQAVIRGDMTRVVKFYKEFGSSDTEDQVCRAWTPEGYSLLCYALKFRQFQIADFLLKKNVAVNTKTTVSTTPLHLTVENGYLDLTEALIRKNAQIDAQNLKGETPLHVAVRSRYLRIIELLICENAQIDAQNLLGETPLHVAVQMEFEDAVRSLLDGGANCFLLDHTKSEPLLTACEGDSINLVKLLLSSRGGKPAGLEQLYLALLIASNSGNEDIVLSLLNAGANPNEVVEPNIVSPKFVDFIKLGLSPLLIACENRHDRVVSLLLKHGALVNLPRLKDNYQPLHVAAEKGCVEIVRHLLNSGADPNSTADDNKTLLHLATGKGTAKKNEALLYPVSAMNAQNIEGSTPFLSAVENNNEEIANLLLNSGAVPNAEADDNSTPLRLASEKGSIKMVEAHLKNAAIVNLQSGKGSPLLLAAKNNHGEIFEILLEHGASINVRDENNCTPLYFALKNSNSSIINSILQYKPEIDEKMQEAFFHAILNGRCQKETVDILIEYGFSIERKDIEHKNMNRLHLNLLLSVVRRGYINILKQLLNLGVDPTIGQRNSDLLKLAVEKGDKEMIQLLIKSGCNANGKSNIDYTPINGLLSVREESKCVEILKLLLANGADIKYAPKLLFQAVENEWVEVCKILIKNGAKVNGLHPYGQPPLYNYLSKSKNYIRWQRQEKRINEASNNEITEEEMVKLLLNEGTDFSFKSKDGFEALHLAVQSRRGDAIGILLDFGACVNARTKDDLTPLHLASKTGLKDIVEMLCKNGANVDASTKDGTTPLHLASEEGHGEIVTILCANKANVNAIRNDGTTPLHIACKKSCKEIAEILCNNGATVNASLKNGSTPLHLVCEIFVWKGKNRKEIVELLCNNKAEVDSPREDGSTPLHLASQRGCKEIVEILCQNKANVDALQTDGSAPLHLAIQGLHKEVAKILLKSKANVNVRFKNGLTPLHLAVGNRNEETVKMLIEFDADIDAQNEANETPLHYAAIKWSFRVIPILLDGGCDVNLENNDEKTALNLLVKPVTACPYEEYSDSDDDNEKQLYSDRYFHELRTYFYGGRHQLIRIFKMHVISLKFAGLHVGEKTLQLLDLKHELLDFQQKCLEQVNGMKNKKLPCHVTLLDVLVNHKNPTFIIDKSTIQTLESLDFKEFPVYEKLLIQSFKECKKRLLL